MSLPVRILLYTAQHSRLRARARAHSVRALRESRKLCYQDAACPVAEGDRATARDRERERERCVSCKCQMIKELLLLRRSCSCCNCIGQHAPFPIPFQRLPFFQLALTLRIVRHVGFGHFPWFELQEQSFRFVAKLSWRGNYSNRERQRRS